MRKITGEVLRIATSGKIVELHTKIRVLEAEIIIIFFFLANIDFNVKFRDNDRAEKKLC